MLRRLFVPFLLLLALVAPLRAAGDLVTLPTRDATQLTFYNFADSSFLYYDLIDFDETFCFEKELVSGKPVPAKIEVERQFDSNVVLWGEGGEPKGWTSNERGAYVDLHNIDLHNVGGRVERVDQQHVKYFLDLKPGKRQRVECSVTYTRRKVGPEINTERKREPL
jgi:hypothetical protein